MIVKLLWSALALVGAPVVAFILVIHGVFVVFMWVSFAVMILKLGAWLLLLAAQGILTAFGALHRLWRRGSTRNHNPN